MTLAGSAIAAAPFAARAQTKMLRVATASAQPRSAPLWVAFEGRMAELGYQEGRNFTFDHVQIPSTNAEAWQAGFRDVVARKADIVVASGPEISLKSALTAPDTKSIVMIAIDYDPLARGYVMSLARPTGSVTGVYLQQIELTMKRVQVLKDWFPDLHTATVFWDGISADQWEAARGAGASLGLRLAGIEFAKNPMTMSAHMLRRRSTIAGTSLC